MFLLRGREMSAVSMPVSRPAGRALVVGNQPSRSAPCATLQRLGFTCAEMDDAYAAMAEICQRPLAYRALILGLSSLYPEELAIIGGVRRRFPHIEIWLTHTDGRQAALAEAMRLGAAGLLSEEGLHRTAVSSPTPPAADVPTAVPSTTAAAQLEPPREPQDVVTDPLLSADELRALLNESTPGSGSEH
jgi:hypothetical protein